jgi:hypothetical protein
MSLAWVAYLANKEKKSLKSLKEIMAVSFKDLISKRWIIWFTAQGNQNHVQGHINCGLSISSPQVEGYGT